MIKWIKVNVSKIIKLIAFLVSLLILTMFTYFLLDLYLFEYIYIFKLFGIEGIGLIIIAVIVSINYIIGNKLNFKIARISFSQRSSIIILFIIILWTLDWTFIPQPKTKIIYNNIRKSINGEKKIENKIINLKIYSNIKEPGRRDLFKIMYNRIASNRGDAYKNIDLGRIIDCYSEKYSVDSVLLFYLLYLTSFYGEAESGKVPFLRNMTGETIRDFIQVHLPTIFVESELREFLINSEILKDINIFNKSGTKWRYAFQKATYDVSLEPYDTNIFTDVFLVMKNYEDEFKDILKNPKNDLDKTIAFSFNKIKDHLLLKPYSQYYVFEKRSEEYYSIYRENFVKFARAIFYKFNLDFDFATQIQALVIKYYHDEFAKELGNAYWDKLKYEQKIVLISIMRDVYFPNIGKTSYNLYSLPEFNLAPFYFLKSEILLNRDELDQEKSVIWIPKDSMKLWAGANTKLFVLNEVWNIIYDKSLTGIDSIKTIKKSKMLLESY